MNWGYVTLSTIIVLFMGPCYGMQSHERTSDPQQLLSIAVNNTLSYVKTNPQPIIHNWGALPEDIREQLRQQFPAYRNRDTGIIHYLFTYTRDNTTLTQGAAAISAQGTYKAYAYYAQHGWEIALESNQGPTTLQIPYDHHYATSPVLLSFSHDESFLAIAVPNKVFIYDLQRNGCSSQFSIPGIPYSIVWSTTDRHIGITYASNSFYALTRSLIYTCNGTSEGSVGNVGEYIVALHDTLDSQKLYTTLVHQQGTYIKRSAYLDRTLLPGETITYLSQPQDAYGRQCTDSKWRDVSMSLHQDGTKIALLGTLMHRLIEMNGATISSIPTLAILDTQTGKLIDYIPLAMLKGPYTVFWVGDDLFIAEDMLYRIPPEFFAHSLEYFLCMHSATDSALKSKKINLSDPAMSSIRESIKRFSKWTKTLLELQFVQDPNTSAQKSRSEVDLQQRPSLVYKSGLFKPRLTKLNNAFQHGHSDSLEDALRNLSPDLAITQIRYRLQKICRTQESFFAWVATSSNLPACFNQIQEKLSANLQSFSQYFPNHVQWHTEYLPWLSLLCNGSTEEKLKTVHALIATQENMSFVPQKIASIMKTISITPDMQPLLSQLLIEAFNPPRIYSYPITRILLLYGADPRVPTAFGIVPEEYLNATHTIEEINKYQDLFKRYLPL